MENTSQKRFIDIGVPDDDHEELVRDEINFDEIQITSFLPIPIVSTLIAQIILVIFIIILSFLFERMCQNNCLIDPYYITQLSHIAMWLIGCAVDRYLHMQHFKSKIRGYLGFYYMTRWIRRSTFYVLSFGNAFLLVTNIVLHYNCNLQNGTCFQTKYKPLNILQILLILESFFIIPGQILYIYYTMKFNKSRPLPDIAQEDLSSPELPSQRASSHFGITKRDYVSELIEKQADAIRALKNHNYILARKIYQLQYVDKAFINQEFPSDQQDVPQQSSSPT